MKCRLCKSASKARGLCWAHLQRWYRKMPLDVPIQKRRRYTEDDKLNVLQTANAAGGRGAARLHKVPASTVHRWLGQQ